MRAVIFGAGNIGRGFLGHLLGQAGYELQFVDVNAALIESLNARGEYPLRLITADGFRDSTVSRVTAIASADAQRVIDAVAQADLLATAVGARALPLVAPVLARGLESRLKQNAAPINILIAENLADANKVLGDLLKENLPAEFSDPFTEQIGLVETTIGRMVPVQTDAMHGDDPLRICGESYGFFPVDSDAWVGAPANIPGLVPASPFSYYVKRKLYVHNMGHALCAYLGSYTGRELIADAIADPAIQLLVENAMLESVQALSSGYDMPIVPPLRHMDDLLLRFGNRLLGDTCQRVGADIPRKLSHDDRLCGAMLYCLEQGITPATIALGAALAAVQLIRQEGGTADMEAVAQVLERYGGLEHGHPIIAMAVSYMPLILNNASPGELARAARALRAKAAGPIV